MSLQLVILWLLLFLNLKWVKLALKDWKNSTFGDVLAKIFGVSAKLQDFQEIFVYEGSLEFLYLYI